MFDDSLCQRQVEKRIFQLCHFHTTMCVQREHGKFLFDMRDYFDMDQYKKNQGEVKCPKCGFPAYPSRFITVCEDGHMDDFPWRWWVHHGETSCKEDMYLKSMGNTSSLAELRVECNCGARRVMSGAMQKEKFAGSMLFRKPSA